MTGAEGKTPSSVEIVRDFIATFIRVWPSGDAASVGTFFSHDAVYHNIPLEPACGRPAIEAVFAEFMRMGGQVSVDIVHLVMEGPIVMTERVDHFHGDDGTISLPLMGIIEIHDGVITSWRDYFDLGQFTTENVNVSET